MNAKLTLSIEKQVIDGAEKYAKEEGRSLSNIVEEYLKSIGGHRSFKNANELDPLVEKLCGSVKIPPNKSYEDILEEAILERYLNR